MNRVNEYSTSVFLNNKCDILKVRLKTCLFFHSCLRALTYLRCMNFESRFSFYCNRLPIALNRSLIKYSCWFKKKMYKKSEVFSEYTSECRIIDLRSDAVSQPTERMRVAMANAVVGVSYFMHFGICNLTDEQLNMQCLVFFVFRMMF